MQRFGSALNLNLHFHALVMDGVVTCEPPFTRAVFHPAPGLEDRDVELLTRALWRRITRYLQRRGQLPREGEGEVAQAEPEEPLLAELAGASIQGRVAMGPKRGAAVTRLRGPSAVRPLLIPGQLCCDVDGFSLHAKVEVGADDRERLERLCRYVARPPLATERLSLSPD
ncbi:MAG: IS91 family transposase, partial [bacterium]|nr:IS91 family transposase [bacterium]